MTGSQLVLSFLPLSKEVKADFPEGSEILAVTTLVQSGIWPALRTLRSTRWARACFVLTTSDPPELRGLSGLVLAAIRCERKEYWILESGQRQEFGWGDALMSVVGCVRATIAGAWAAARNVMAARRAARTRRARRESGGRGSVAYLRANFGMPAVGGSVGHTTGVIEAMLASGLQVTFFGAAAPEGLPPACGTVVVPLPRDVSCLHELNRHRYSRQFARAVLATYTGERPGFFYQRYALNDLSGVRVARRLRRPLVVEYNGSDVWAQRNWGNPLRFEGGARAVERACLRAADLVVTVSETLGEEVREAGVSGERVLVYPNGVDTVRFESERFDAEERRRLRSRLDVPADACVATMVSTFGRWHGAEVLARAINRVPRSVDGRRIHYLFVGDGPAAEAVRRIIESDGNTDRVTMAGVRPQSETPLTLAASDILVAPNTPNADGSAFFGSPTKVFEYMASAKPIVASDLGQIGLVLRGWSPGSRETCPDPAAVLVEPGDPLSLASGIEAVACMDRDARARMGGRARDFVLRAFTWKHHVAAILAALDAQSARRGEGEDEFGHDRG